MRIKNNPFATEIAQILFMPEGVRVPLSGGHSHKYALVSPEDAHLVYGQRWYLGHGYATSNTHRMGTVKGDTNRNMNSAMHRMIMCAPTGLVIDHINGDRLDNRRENLRIVSPVANNYNRIEHRDRMSTRNKTGYVGVVQQSPKTWVTHVGTNTYGAYYSAEFAARVYDEVVRRLHGSHILHQNFPGKPLPANFKISGLDRPNRRSAHQSPMHGVTWFKPRNKWRVIIDRVTLKYFDTQAEAEAYRKSLGDDRCVLKQ